MEPRRQRLSQRRKAAERSVIFPSHSEFQQDGAEFANLFRPQQVALGSPPRAPRSEGADPQDPDSMALAGSSAHLTGDTQPPPVEPIDTPATIALDAFPAKTRRVKRFAVLGALAAAGVAASVSGVTFLRAPAAMVGSESEAHVAVIPASDVGSSASLAGGDHPVPVAASIKNAEGPIPSSAATAPKPAVPRHANRTETTSQSKPKSSTVAPQPDRRPSSAEAYLWSQAAELGEYDPRWKPLTSPRP